MNRSTLRIIVIILTLITALIHLALGIAGIASGFGGALDYIFVLNAIGYVVLLGAVLMPKFPFFAENRPLAYYLLIFYAGVTFVLYFVFNGFSNFGPAAIVAKTDEALLIIATFLYLNASE